MSFVNSLLVIAILIATSAFFSVSEISLAAARKIKLRQLVEEGNTNAERVLELQEQPGHFFTVVQIGLNAVAILAGILGEAAFTPYFATLLHLITPGDWVEHLSFILSFASVTALFVLFADLMPKRLGMVAPERVALLVVRPMMFCVALFRPLVWLFNGLANVFFRMFGVPTARPEDLTPADLLAMMDAGAEAGVLQQREHHLIENVFELESRTVPSSMTGRDSIIYFTLQEDETSIKQKIAGHPHTKFLVCDGVVDAVVGYVDSKDILMRLVNQQSLSIKHELTIRNVLIVPDSLTLSELLERFKASREDFAVVMNEYALVVGVITLNDLMSTVMGDLVSQFQEEQIVRRDDHSWLVDGATPVEDVLRALDIDAFPDDENYETVAGFMMYMLRRIPKRTDSVEFEGYKFEVVDIDNYRIDQLLVTLIPPVAASEESAR
ncbi:hemolysin family protein [Chromobacterium sp. IIBBL 290-4]|uniref:hemolysin family protein n=1 Tax=Chromobacterium sp. IIBBL 290-4 TaxID=2953890 RepID=UPI0020B6978B|nr:hemolysin family protein [Chromobacterium sp. IIBBL 290-4]UTH75463.1 hemolysin family protein [Chromobacterium sp. IIBBL 290-4]